MILRRASHFEACIKGTRVQLPKFSVRAASGPEFKPLLVLRLRVLQRAGMETYFPNPLPVPRWGRPPAPDAPSFNDASWRRHRTDATVSHSHLLKILFPSGLEKGM